MLVDGLISQSITSVSDDPSQCLVFREMLVDGLISQSITSVSDDPSQSAPTLKINGQMSKFELSCSTHAAERHSGGNCACGYIEKVCRLLLRLVRAD